MKELTCLCLTMFVSCASVAAERSESFAAVLRGCLFAQLQIEGRIAKDDEVAGLIRERFEIPLGMTGDETTDLRLFYRMLAANGKSAQGRQVMNALAVKLQRRKLTPRTSAVWASHGMHSFDAGRTIGHTTETGEEIWADPDLGVCSFDAVRKPVRTAVFTGLGPMGLSSTELIRLVARSPELAFVPVDAEDVRRGGLAGCDMLVMPGGNSGMIKGDLGEVGVAKLKEFVRNGGGYLGICAGCVLTLSDLPGCGISLVPFTREAVGGAYDGDCATTIRLNDVGAKMLGMDAGEHGVWYSGGPYLAPSRSVPEGASITPWAVYSRNVRSEGDGARMDGMVALVGGTYGKGRLVACSCHPEFHHSCDRLVETMFGYVAGRRVSFPQPAVSKGALKVAYYSWPVAGKECAVLLMELDADSQIEVCTVERDDLLDGKLDQYDALIIPDGADWSLKVDIFPPELNQAVADFAAKGRGVYSWGRNARHLPPKGIHCRSGYDLYRRLR